MNRKLSTQEYSLISTLIHSLHPETAKILQEQLNATKLSGGKLTMLELSVDSKAPKIEQIQGPLPVKATVVNDKKEPIGELLLWTTNGYLSQLEYAWITDEIPNELPELSHIIISS